MTTPTLADLQTGLAAVKAQLDVVQAQNQHLATSLPLTFHAPFTPKCAATGLDGQEILRGLEESGWELTASGLAASGDPTARGLVNFNGVSSHVDYSLRRRTADDPEGVDGLYNAEIITLMQVRPQAFNATQPEQLAFLGAMGISIAPSTTNEAAVKIGVTGNYLTTAKLRLNEWNDLAFAFSRRASQLNYPRVRVSINGAAQEAWNLDSNQAWGPIGSNTSVFRLGGHGTGATSAGFTGQARAIFVHPSQVLYGDYGWDIPTGLRWHVPFQLWVGAQIMDRVEGLPIDTIQAQITDIQAKSYGIDDLALAPWRQPAASLTSATGSIGKHLAGLLNGPSAQDVLDLFNAQPIAGGVSRLGKERIDLACNAGPWTRVNDRIEIREGDNLIVAADLTATARSNISITIPGNE